MASIINILRKLKFLFFFIVLQTICIRTFLKLKTYHESIFLEKVSNATGSINDYFSSWYDYFALTETNHKLKLENVMLRNILMNTYALIPQNSINKTDTILNTEDNLMYTKQYKILDAKVIHATTQYSNNYFQIQRGSLQGVKKDMGVMSAEGIAGIVIHTSENFSNVLSVLNMSAKISAKLKHYDVIGYAQWDGKRIDELVIENYPLSYKISIGDTVVTSQYSDKFIENTIIGTVSEYALKGNKNSYKIRIKLSVNFNKLSHVYLIENEFQNQIKELKKTFNNTYNEKQSTEQIHF